MEKCGIVQNDRVVHKLVSEGLLSDKAFKIQRCIYDIAQPSLIVFSLHKYLLHKFQRWYGNALSENYARRAIFVLQFLRDKSSPVCFACYIHYLG